MAPIFKTVIGNEIKQDKQNHGGTLENFSEKVNLNAYRIDLSEAHIYKYTIVFEPKQCFSHKEKKQLAHMFLSTVGIDTCSPQVVVGDNFEIFLPYPNLQLMQGGMQVPFAKLTNSKGNHGKVLVGAAVASNDFTWSQIQAVCEPQPTKISGDIDSKVPKVINELQYCKVTAQGSGLPLKALPESKDETIQRHVLGALDKIFQRNATVPSNGNGLGKFGASTTLLAMGNNVFDLSGNPVYSGDGFQLRVGIKTSTQILDHDIIKTVSPTYGAFLEPMNLAEMVLQFYKRAQLDRCTTRRLEELLKGVTIKSTYGSGKLGQITELGLSPSLQEVVLDGQGRVSVEDYMMQEHGHKVHSSYANLPCVKMGNVKSDRYLPMSVCQVLPGQKVGLLLLKEMGVLTKSELNLIEKKGETAANCLQDDHSDFGRSFLFRAMSPQTFTAFNIKVEAVSKCQASWFWSKQHVKEAISLSSHKLIMSIGRPEVPAVNKFKGMPLTVFLLMKELPSDHAEIVARLFDGYEMKLDKVRVFGENVGLDDLSMAAVSGQSNGLKGHSECVVFILQSKAKDKQLEEAVRQTKASCEAAKWPVKVVSVKNFSASPQTSEISEKIAKAFRALHSNAEASPNSIKASAEVSPSKFSCVAVYVVALPGRDQSQSKFGPEAGAMTTVRKQDESRDFVVTIVIMNPKTGAFETRSYSQTCHVDTHATAGTSHNAEGKCVYSGVHCIDPKDAKDMQNFLQSSMSGSENTRLIIFRAGVLPLWHGSTSSSLDAETEFFSKFADAKRYSMEYYSTSSPSSTRLTPPSPASALVHSAFVVKSDDAKSHKWLIQKECPTGSPARPIVLTLLRGDREKAENDLLGPDSAVFSALWSFPPGVQSAKELAPVAVARKITRRLVKDLKEQTAYSNGVLAEKSQVQHETPAVRQSAPVS